MRARRPDLIFEMCFVFSSVWQTQNGRGNKGANVSYNKVACQMVYICMFFFEQRPCVHLSSRSSGAYLRSSSTDQPKLVPDVGLVCLLPELEHQVGPAEGSWWEVSWAGTRASTGEESYLVISAYAARSRLVDSTDGRERSVFRQS